MDFVSLYDQKLMYKCSVRKKIHFHIQLYITNVNNNTTLFHDNLEATFM